MKTANWTLNILGVVCASVVIWQFVQNLNFQSTGQFLRPGSHIKLPNPRSARARKIVLALSTSCTYCRASAGFYRTLLASAGKGGVPVLALFREPATTYQPLLPSLGIEGAVEVHQADFAPLGVEGTPTLLIVDQNSTLEAAWTGQLDTIKEKEVFKQLGLIYAPHAETAPEPTSSTEVPISSEKFRDMYNDPDLVVLDIRERESLPESHIAGSLNVPIAELWARVPHEISRDKPVAVYCNEELACESAKREEGVMTACSFTVKSLREMGFSRVSVIKDDVCTLADVGLPVVRTAIAHP